MLGAVAMFGMVSCTQVAPPSQLGGDRGQTKDMFVDHHNCKVVLSRVHGEDQGTTLLGLIPLSVPSEAVAIDKMYESARSRGAQPEGNARQFANVSVERTSHNMILIQNHKLRATGDLVQFVGPAAE